MLLYIPMKREWEQESGTERERERGGSKQEIEMSTDRGSIKTVIVI